VSTATGAFRFVAVEGWPRIPEEAGFIEAVGIAISSEDEVFVFARAALPVLVFNGEGQYLRGWGEGLFVRPHGIWIGPDGSLFLTDDMGHSVRQFSPDGELIRAIGSGGVPSASGIDGMDYRTIRPDAGPFNMPTNLVTGPQGDLFITDGYGNAQVHRFTASGELLASWGEPGDGPGQFNVPHGIAVDADGRLYICDRENSRIQIFTPNGGYIQSWDWVSRPTDIFIDDQDFIHVAELAWSGGVQTHIHSNNHECPPAGHDPISRVTVCDPDGQIVARVGGNNPVLPGNFIAPHGLWCDSRGDLYVGEVISRIGAVDKLAPLTVQAFQKFKRSG